MSVTACHGGTCDLESWATVMGLLRAMRSRLRASAASCALVRVLLIAGVLAPLALGASFAPLVHALGGTLDHRCACGMVPGQCGCPECVRLEHARLRAKAPSAVPVLKSQCGDDDAIVTFDPLPVAAPQLSAMRIARPSVSCNSVDRIAELDSAVPRPPPVPPPRSAGLGA